MHDQAYYSSGVKPTIPAMAKRRTDSKRFLKAFGLKLRSLRESLGWTLEDTEEHGWPNWTHLQRIEAGKNITVQTLVNIANLYGVHPAELLKDV